MLQDLPPERQLLQSLEKFLLSLKQPEFSPEHQQRSWAIITSTSANAASYEEIDYTGEGHARMTGLILKALQGNVPETLDSGKHLTLGRLYEYLKQMTTTMDRSGSPKQNLIMDSSFRHNLMLAYHPTAHVPSPDSGGMRPNPPGREPQQYFDATFCSSATFADLNIAQLRTFLKGQQILNPLYRQSAHNEQEQLKLLGMLQEEHPSYGALLCFGHTPSHSSRLTGAFTRCIYWNDDQRLQKKDDQTYQGSLLEQFAQVQTFLEQHLGAQISKGAQPELGKLYYRVLEEAVVNALIHREYVTEHNNRVQARGVMVEILNNRIEISNPGKPIVGIKALREASERHLGPHPRNPQITYIFRLAYHAEEAGTGVMRIQQWVKEAGLPSPDFAFNEQTQTLTVTLFRGSTSHNEASDHSEDPKPLPDTDNDEKQGDISQVSTKILKILENEQGSKSSPSLPLPPPLPTYTLNKLAAVTSPFLWKRVGQFSLLIFLSIALVASGVLIAPFIQTHFNSSPTHTPSPTPQLAPASTTIEIASDFPTTGLETVSELSLQSGVQMAIDEANHNNMLPGYTIKIAPYNDTGSGNRPDPRVGAGNIQHAIADNLVAGIVGPGNSAVALAELPVANQAPIALISPNTTYPCLTKSVISDSGNCSGGNDIQAQVRPTDQLTYFRLATTDDLQGKAAADYFYTTLHYHKVLILNDYSDPYSSGLASTFQGEWTTLGGQAIPLALSESASSAQDYQKVLQNAAPDQPDLIYFAGDDPNGTYVLQALANIPALKNVALAGGDGIVDSAFLSAAAQFHPNAPVYASLPIQDPSFSGTTAGIDFQQNYAASGYTNYRAYAASSYDCTMMLIQAIKLALQKVSTPHGLHDTAGVKQFRLAVLQALAHLTYTGATGKQSFDANGDTTNHTISFYQLDLSNPQASWRWISQGSV